MVYALLLPQLSSTTCGVSWLGVLCRQTHFVDEPNKTFKLDELRAFLTEKGVGLYDTATAVNRITGTAADKDLEVVEPTDL